MHKLFSDKSGASKSVWYVNHREEFRFMTDRWNTRIVSSELLVVDTQGRIDTSIVVGGGGGYQNFCLNVLQCSSSDILREQRIRRERDETAILTVLRLYSD